MKLVEKLFATAFFFLFLDFGILYMSIHLKTHDTQ